MKILIALVWIGILMVGCTTQRDPTFVKNIENQGYAEDMKAVVEVEGCEYFKVRNYSGYHSYTHKGNCRNKIHKRDKDLTDKEVRIEELREQLDALEQAEEKKTDG